MKLSLRNVFLLALGVMLALLGSLIHHKHAREAKLGRPLIADGVPDEDLTQILVGGTAPKAPPSPWLEVRTRRYASLFKGFKCDTLVLPIQVEGLAFDRPNREIMSADLSLAVQGDGRCVADPYLVDLALGEGMRRRDPSQVLALAQSLGATTIISTYAGHDRSGWMRVTVQVAEFDAGNPTAGAKIRAAHSITGFKYGEDHPPFLSFEDHLPQILNLVHLKQFRRPDEPTAPAPEQFPLSPASFIQPEAATPVSEAAGLVFLAMLGPSSESRASERLLTKAWVILEPLAESDPVVRNLRVRILYHLYERPYALALLGNATDPQAVAFRALLNGNLFQARAALTTATTSLERFLYGVELHDLEMNYDRPTQGTRAAVLDLFRNSPWQPLVSARLNDHNARGETDTRPIGDFLKAAYPLPDASANMDRSASGGSQPTAAAQLAALRQVHNLIEHPVAPLCCASFQPSASSLDLLYIADSRIESLLIKQAAFQIETLAKPAGATAILEAYDPDLAGNPGQEQLRAEVLKHILQFGQATDRDLMITQFHDTAHAAVWWEQGQTRASRLALWYLEQPPKDPSVAPMRAFSDDYPPRPYWNEDEAILQTALAYSSFDAAILEDLLRLDHALPVQTLNSRFAGSPDATQLWLDHLPEADQRSEVLKAAIQQDPDNWYLYKGLGWLLLHAGRYTEVPGAVLAYPGFHEADPEDTVALSDLANDWGNELLWCGAEDAAKPLYQQAMTYKNGSLASISASVRLALIDRHYADAVAGYLDGARQYDDVKDYAGALRLLFALDRGEAWPLFDEQVSRFDAPVLWYSAIVGHRRANLGEDSLRQWFGRHAAAVVPKGRLSVARAAFMEEFTDRQPAAGAEAFINALEGSSSGFVVNKDGRVYHAKPESWPIRDVGPSAFGDRRHPVLSAGTVVPGRMGLLTQAFARFRAADYAAAAQAFDKLSAYYYIEAGDTALVLPYFAFAESQIGDPLHLRNFVDKPYYTAFDYLLARAVFNATGGDFHRSAELLELASERWHNGFHDEDLDTAYVFLDICALLYENTHDDRYRTFAVGLARNVVVVEPTASYAYAAIAYMGDDERERAQALAKALYLDPQSEWSRKTPLSVQIKARALLAAGSPFAG